MSWILVAGTMTALVPIAEEASAYGSEAQDGSPDAYGYTYEDSKNPPPTWPFAWVPRDPIAMEVWFPVPGFPLNDTLYGPFTFSTFQFIFYGVPYDSFWVSDNGFITFNNTLWPLAPAWPDHPRPSGPNNFISCFGDGLNPDPLTGGGGLIYWWEDPASQIAVVTWENITRDADGAPQFFQLILTAAGTATCQFQDVTFKGGPYPPLTAIENDPGEIGLQYYDFLEDSLAVRFVPPAAPASDTLQVTWLDRAPFETEPTDYDTLMLQLDLSALTGSAGVASLVVNLLGPSPTTDVTNIALWWDRDRDGFPNHWVDTPLVRAAPSAGLPATLDLAAAGVDPILVIAGADITLLLTIDIAAATSGFTVSMMLLAVNLVASTPDTVLVIPGLPGTSAPVNLLLNPFLDTLVVTPANLVLPGASAAQGEGSVPILGLTLTNPDFRDVEVTAFEVVLNGTATSAEVTDAKLYRDADGDGIPNPAVDPLVAVAAFGAGPPYRANLSFAGDDPPYLGVYPGQVITFFVAVDIAYTAATGPTVGLEVASAWFTLRPKGDAVILGPPDPFQSAQATIDPFFRPLIPSFPLVQPVTADGVMNPGEWETDSLPIPLDATLGNQVPTTLYIKNDATRLYMGLDAGGDASRRAFDRAGVLFDAPHDDFFTDGADSQFTLGGLTSQSKVTGHAVYNASAGDWVMEDSPFNTGLPGHTGLEGGAGYSTPSILVSPHRTYELAIPLTLLGASPGDTIGFAIYSTAPDVVDGDPDTYQAGDERTWRYSAWPLHYRGAPPPPPLWAELCLDPCAAGNTPPELFNGSVAPDPGDPVTTLFSWNVTYRDADNDSAVGAPVVLINQSGTPIGPPFAMTQMGWVGAPNDYTTGARYTYNRTLSVCGSNYTYQFSASDGQATNTTALAAGPRVTCPNTPPELLGPGVIPTLGGEATNFTYNVTFRDADNDPFSRSYVWINESGAPIGGSPFALSLENWVGAVNDTVAGANLSYRTTLPLCGGSYTFVFNASDGQAEVFSASSPGPQVNCAPSFNWTGEVGWQTDGVEDDEAPLGSAFQWRVDYYDADDDAPAPTYPRVVLWWGAVEVVNGTMWEANPADTDHTDGKRYVFVTNLVNPGTNYSYCFLAEDSFGQSATPLCAAGPNVTAVNLPPEMINGQVTPPSQTGPTFPFEYNVTYRDPEDQPPAFVWVHVNESGTPIAGSPFQMFFVTFLGGPGNYTAGAVFNRTVTLPCGGSYGFAFQGNDGWNDNTTVTAPGPTLNCPPNIPPVLSSPLVNPVSGDTTTVFTYSVVYSDADNDPPFGTPWVLINESGAPFLNLTTAFSAWMGVPGDWGAGASYNVTTTLGTASNAYTFVFGGTDGADLDYSAETDAPDVAPGPDGLTVTHTDVAPAVVNQGEAGVLMMILHLNAAPGSVDLVALNVTLAGTAGDADLDSVSLYEDVDASGTVTPPDLLLGQEPVLFGEARFSGFVLSVPGGGQADALVVYAFSPTATLDALAGATVNGPQDMFVPFPDFINPFGPLSSSTSRVNAAPSAVGLTVQGYPSGNPGLIHITDHTPALAWVFQDPNAGDPQAAYNASVLQLPGFTLLWYDNTTGAGNSVLYPGVAPALVDGGDYLFRVSVQDTLKGLWSVPAELAFHLNALPPPPTEPAAPHNVTLPAAAGEVVSWTSGGLDPEGDALTYAWQVAVNDTGFSGPSLVSQGTTAAESSAPFATVPLSDYYWRVNVTDGWETTAFGPTWRGYWNFSTEPPPNVAPTLSWTDEANYVGDGLHPETGFLDTTFVYRVRYADPNGDPPLAGTPTVVILKGGTEIANASMAFDAWVGGPNDYAAGAIYAHATTLTALGTDYAYRFYAEDDAGAVASGVATALTAGPTVSNRPPLLDWTGGTNYEADGLHPETGDPDTSFVYRIEYTDPDNHPPAAGFPRLIVLKGGVNITGSPFTMAEVDPSDVNYANGKEYQFTTSLPEGTDYEYAFLAEDTEGGAAATGTVDAPDVVLTVTVGSISILVVDEDGQPVDGATVRLTDGTILSATPTGAGTYGFTNVTPGSYILEVAKPGFQTHTSLIQIDPGQNDPLTVTLQTEAPEPFDIADYWWIFLLLMVLLLAVVAFLGWRRGRPPAEDLGEPAFEEELAKELEDLKEAVDDLEAAADADSEGFDEDFDVGDLDRD